MKLASSHPLRLSDTIQPVFASRLGRHHKCQPRRHKQRVAVQVQSSNGDYQLNVPEPYRGPNSPVSGFKVETSLNGDAYWYSNIQ